MSKRLQNSLLGRARERTERKLKMPFKINCQQQITDRHFGKGKGDKKAEKCAFGIFFHFISFCFNTQPPMPSVLPQVICLIFSAAGI